MNGNYQTETRRLYLIEDLPAPLTRASRHWQIFDNYIENTRLRLRSIRVPETKAWTWILEQRFPIAAPDLSVWNCAQIRLSEREHAVFELFEGRQISKNERAETNEIRKNRYFYNFNERELEIDVYLGALWGLNTAKIVFENADDYRQFDAPPMAIAEITNNEFFIGENLIGKTFADVQDEFFKLAGQK